RLPVVRDEDELGVLLHIPQHFDEAADVCIIKRCVDLIEETEWARLVLEQPEHEGNGRQRFFSARQQLNALESLAGRLRNDFDAALERVVLVEERQACASPPEQSAEGLLKVDVDSRECFGKALTRHLVDALYRPRCLRDGLDEIEPLACKERMAGLELVELLDGHPVGWGEAFGLRSQPGHHPT